MGIPGRANSPSGYPRAKAAVLFLMNGMDADNNEAVEDKRIRAAKRGAVIDYIKSSVSRFAHRESELLEEHRILGAKGLLLTGYSIGDARSEIDSITSEIDELQQEISSNIEQSKWLMSEIYANNGKLAECETLADRFAALRSQYQSDIKRLAFVIDGNLAHSSLPIPEHCPFCESEIPASNNPLHTEAARAELQHIRVHLKELYKAEHDLTAKRTAITSTVEELEHKKHNIDASILLELKPRMTELKERLIMYRKFVEINKELEFVQNEERMLNGELTERETEPEEKAPKYDIDRFFDPDTMQTFEDKLISILKSCHFEGAGSARLNISTFDLEVGGRAKAISNGGGYCGFLNTVLALTLVEYLAEYGEYSPGLLVADSPLTQLSESEFKAKTDTMKSGFLEYLLSIYKNELSPSKISGAIDKQIIIIEQKEKLPMLNSIIKGEEHVRVIEFTRDKNHGRYGFLNGVFGHE